MALSSENKQNVIELENLHNEISMKDFPACFHCVYFFFDSMTFLKFSKISEQLKVLISSVLWFVFAQSWIFTDD